MEIRDRIGLSTARQRQASWAMQLALVGFVFVGIYEMNLGVTINATIALLVTHLPAVLERDFGIPMDPGLILWITTAVFLHTVGILGLPWMAENVYVSIWWWDHLTHALSSSIVAGVGYAIARALDGYIDDLDFPPRFMFPFILIVTLATGVLWEIIEFVVAELSVTIGIDPALTQYGVGDTMLDLVFNALGAVIVALWGVTRLEPISEAIRVRLERHS
jgi:hypothetical protein